jgi:hypothetical protein
MCWCPCQQGNAPTQQFNPTWNAAPVGFGVQAAPVGFGVPATGFGGFGTGFADPTFGAGFGTGFADPTFGAGFGTGFADPTFGAGFGTGFANPAFGFEELEQEQMQGQEIVIPASV